METSWTVYYPINISSYFQFSAPTTSHHEVNSCINYPPLTLVPSTYCQQIYCVEFFPSGLGEVKKFNINGYGMFHVMVVLLTPLSDPRYRV